MPRTARSSTATPPRSKTPARSTRPATATEPLRELRLNESQRPSGPGETSPTGNRNPVSRQEAEQLLRKAHEHARNPNFFEPAEAAELAARARAAANQQADDEDREF